MTQAILVAILASVAYAAGFITALAAVERSHGEIAWTRRSRRDLGTIFLAAVAFLWITIIGGRLIREMIP